jgi:Protein of unknown function (DUF3489)
LIGHSLPNKTDARSKQARIIAMLQSPTGTTIPAIMTATGWQQHSVRGFLAGVVRKRLKLKLASKKINGNRIYQIASGESRFSHWLRAHPGCPTIAAARSLRGGFFSRARRRWNALGHGTRARLVGGLFGVASVFGNCSVIDISEKFASQRTKGHLARIGYMRPRHSENCVHGPCFVDGATA